MSIAALYELQERLNNTAIAGVPMIGEDFRLHRAIEQFTQTAPASPVFQKIAQQLQPLLQPNTSDRATALMDVLALIDAVLYTQGTTQVSGSVESITVNPTTYVPCRYSEIQPLKQALTEKGSGRYEIVRSAFEAKSPALRDYRLQGVLIEALGDSYSEMADLVKSILIAEDERIIPLLKQQLDPKGKREMARRVEVIEQIAKHRENEFYLTLLDNSSSLVKEAAVHALKHDQDNTDVLIQLAETEKGTVKQAAYTSLAYMHNDRAEALWLKHANKNPADVADYLDRNCSDALSDVVAVKLEQLIVPIIQEQRTELQPAEVESLRTLVRMTINKSSEALLHLFELLADHESLLGKLRDQQRAQQLICGSADSGLLPAVNLKLIEGMISGLNEEILPAAEQLYRHHEASYLHAGFAAALLSKPAQIVYDEFAPMVRDADRFDIIAACLSQVRYDEQKRGYYLYESSYSGRRYRNSEQGRPLYAALDDRWIELLTSVKKARNATFKRLSQMINYVDSVYTGNKVIEKYDVMLMGLIDPHNKHTSKLLYRYFLEATQVMNSDVQLYALYRLGHRQFHDLLLQLVQRANLSTYQLKHVCHDLHLTREEEIALIQELLVRLGQKNIKSRYLTASRLQTLLQQLESGEEVSYW